MESVKLKFALFFMFAVITFQVWPTVKGLQPFINKLAR